MTPPLVLDRLVVTVHAPPVEASGAVDQGGRPRRRTVLHGASLRIEPGEAVGLVGPSGAGKTLLTRAALGLLPPGARIEAPTSIRVAGREMAGASQETWQTVRGRQIGAVFQDPASTLTPVRPVGGQLREVLRCHGRPEDEAHALLEEVGLDAAAVHDRIPHELSGGQRQRVGLALALAPEPRLLIADEPTAALDAVTEGRILDLLGRIRTERELALLLVSHDPGVVARLCTRTVRLVVPTGDGGSSGAYASREAAPGGERETAPTLDLARGAADAPTTGPADVPTPRPGGAPALEVVGLHVGYRKAEWVVRDVSVRVMPGELLGLVGASGCGKTSLLRGILGLAPRRTGQVCVGGVPVDEGRAGRTAFRRRVQGVWQDAFGALDPRLSVARALDEVLRAHAPSRSGAWRAGRARDLLDRVGLDHRTLELRPGALSGGERQRVGLARALAVEPDVLLMDEPVSALDPSARDDVLDLVARLVDELGLAGILCAHDLGVVARRCPRVAVMAGGRIVERGPTRGVLAAPRDPRTSALTALLSPRPGSD